MLAAQVNIEFTNSNLPQVITTARQRRIIDAGNPSLWLTPDRRYFEVDEAGKLIAWHDALNPLKLLPVGVTPPLVTARAVAAFTGSIVTAASIATLTVTAVASGVLSAGQDILTGAVAGTRILRQLTGAAGGAGTYQVNTAQTVAAGTALTSSALNSVDFAGSAASSLYESSLADIWPASGTPGTVVALTYNTSGAGTFGGGIAGSPVAVADFPVALFVNSTSGNFNLQTAFGTGGRSVNGTALYNNDAWHFGLASYAGTGPGAYVRTDGAVDSALGTNTLILSGAANAQTALRRLVVGGYGPNGSSNPLKGRLAALMILPVDLSAPANVQLLADVEAEFTAMKTALAS